jgi:hypothetical protein
MSTFLRNLPNIERSYIEMLNRIQSTAHNEELLTAFFVDAYFVANGITAEINNTKNAIHSAVHYIGPEVVPVAINNLKAIQAKFVTLYGVVTNINVMIDIDAYGPATQHSIDNLIKAWNTARHDLEFLIRSTQY